MKSAYDIAMERLAKQGDEEHKLTDGQKGELAEIDRVYDAKIAERKVIEDPEIASLRTKGMIDEANVASERLSTDIMKIEEERERKKDKVRNRT